MAVLFRLYACYLDWYARSRGFDSHMPEGFQGAFPHVFKNTRSSAASLKRRLFCTVAHEVHVAARKVTLGGPSGLVGLKVQSVRVPGTNRTEHFVLYPGARREQSLRTRKAVFTVRFMNRARMVFDAVHVASAVKVTAVAACGVNSTRTVLPMDPGDPLSANERFKPP